MILSILLFATPLTACIWSREAVPLVVTNEVPDTFLEPTKRPEKPCATNRCHARWDAQMDNAFKTCEGKLGHVRGLLKKEKP